MKTLFIDRKNSLITVDRNRIRITTDGAKSAFSIPTCNVEMLVISAQVQFTSTLLTKLTQEGITAVFLNPRQTCSNTMTLGMMHNDAKRRLRQYKIVCDDKLKLQYSTQIVAEKLRCQRSMLLHALKLRPDCRFILLKSIASLAESRNKSSHCSSLSSLRGIEGSAAAAYFSGYQTLFPASLHFIGRNRRPPQDPVNVILSLTYSMLHAEAVRVLFSMGFDPFLGVYHEPTFGRESLACDLIELFRPLADRWIWRLFADGTLTSSYFSQLNSNQKQSCLLDKSGRKIYYAAYATEVHVWRQLIRRVCRHWMIRLKTKEDL
jgi:CRISP-associated protein Cas1